MLKKLWKWIRGRKQPRPRPEIVTSCSHCGAPALLADEVCARCGWPLAAVDFDAVERRSQRRREDRVMLIMLVVLGGLYVAKGVDRVVDMQQTSSVDAKLFTDRLPQ